MNTVYNRVAIADSSYRQATMKLPAYSVKLRLDYYWSALQDPDVGKVRATNGLKSWISSQKHRLTAFDIKHLEFAINKGV